MRHRQVACATAATTHACGTGILPDYAPVVNPGGGMAEAGRSKLLTPASDKPSSPSGDRLPTSPNGCIKPVTPLEGLLNLLVDLKFVDDTEQPPREALPSHDEEAGVESGWPKQQVISQKLDEPENQPPSQAILADGNTNEDFVCSSSDPNPQTASPTESLLDLLVDQKIPNRTEEPAPVALPFKLLTPGADLPTFPPGEELPTEEKSSTHSVAQPDALLNRQADLQIVNHASPPPLESLPDKEEEAGVAEDVANLPPPPQVLEEQAEAPSDQSIPGAPATDDGDDSESRLERLRTLLLTPELVDTQHIIANLKQKLANLERQINDPPELIELLLPLIADILSRKVAESEEEIVAAIAPIIDQVIHSRTEQDKAAMSAALAPVLSTAISQQISNSREEITTALGPAMAGAIKEQIVVEREAMVDALYPVIGSTISKYMVEEIRAINEKIENTMSVEGISRKIRAKMQGVSEAELILKEVMPFTVQAIFLIHKGSGLVISEAQPSGSQRLESEMVAGMLTAIRSFVNDCIAQSGTVSELNQIEYGNSKIVLEVAGYCYLAVVIQGEPPQRFIRKLRQTLSTIVQSYGKPIELFDGDPATIPDQVQPFIEGLMETRSLPHQKSGKPPALAIAGSVLLSLIVLPWGIYQYRRGIDSRIEADTASALASAPELAVYRLNVHAGVGTLKLSGKLPNQYLRQRAEQIASMVAPNWKLDNSIIAVNVPTDPVLTAAEVKRVTSIMNQRDGVAIWAQYAAGKVTIEGTVRQDSDVEKITQAFEQIPGVYSVSNTAQAERLKIATRIFFESGSANLTPAETDKIIQIKEFLNRYPEKGIRIIGHSDPSGNAVQNERLALKRAEVVRNALVSQGVAPSRLQVVGTHPPLDVGANQPLWLSRYVELEIVNTDTKSQ